MVPSRDADLARRLDDARRASAAAPDRPDPLVAYGALLRASGALADAQLALERAVMLAPGHADARFQLAELYAGVGNYEAAIPHYEALVALVPGSLPALTLLAQALAVEGRSADALAILERALALAPHDAAVLATHGMVLAEVGRIDAAGAVYRRAIEAAPHNAYAYHALAKLRPAALTANDRRTLETLAGAATATARDRWEASFALAIACDADGDYARAAQHLLVANALRRRSVAYDEGATLAALDRSAQTDDAAFPTAPGTSAIDDELPVFIFGLPRSGTTLVDQILASHPRVFGAGELPRFEMHANELLGAGGALDPQIVRAADAERLREIGRRYVADLRRRAPAAARITDKMTLNFRFAGLIHRLLPRARMIHVRRAPGETALSCFMQNFAGELGWPYDLGEIGRYFRAYERLMAHWRAVLPPDAMLEVRYEDVVDDLAGQARRIVAFCGLEWDDACLRFYETARTVRTASARDVRQPIYRTSLERAQHYRDLLRPFAAAYGEE